MKQKEKLLQRQRYTPTFMGSMSAARVIRKPFSENDILDLQDRLLTNGFQFFNVCSMHQGRAILLTLLDALDCYHAVGCFSLNYAHPDQDICNIAPLLDETMTTKEEMVNFLLEQCYFDFFWIEATTNLIKNNTFQVLYEALGELKMERAMPIVILL